MQRFNPCLFFLFLFSVNNFLNAQQASYEVEKLNIDINTNNYDEITPVISLDGKTLYFTRVGYPDFNKTLIEDGENMYDKLGASSFNKYLAEIFSYMEGHRVNDPIQSGFNQDIWVAKCVDGEFDQVLHPDYPLNNAMPNSVSSVTPASNELVVINRFEKDGGMKKGFSIVRDLGNGDWSFPEPIGIENYYNTGTDVNMTMNSDGNVIILSMRGFDSRGQNDLYISFKTGLNQWSMPKNMGNVINTGTTEITPYLSEDNKILFFSSNRKGSYSGNDLYISYRDGDDWMKWSKPQPLVEPINSKVNDSQPFFNSATGYLYFTSTRDGSSDIFRAKIAPAVPRFVTVKGRILDENNKPVKARLISGNANDDSYQNVYIADNGTFTISVPKGQEFKIAVQRPGYFDKEETLMYRSDYVYFKDKHINFKLEKIKKGTNLDLPPVYFEQSKAVVKKESYPVLDDLGDFLKKNYNVRIKVEGHTDNQGDKDALQKLSEDRAKAIKNYLVGKRRINPLRIAVVGHGGSKPISENATEATRAKNRRVEVYVDQVFEVNSIQTAGKVDKGGNK